MNVSLRWLEELFPPHAMEGITAEEIARRLTLRGLAVDAIRSAFPTFSGVVLAKVLAAHPHPQADRLTLCTVVAGDGERQVVCGAPNVQVGAIYGYAMEGARLPGDRRIRRTTIRGVESQGMLCSAPELGLDALGSAEGIWTVPGVGEGDLGRDLREALRLDDVVLEIDVPSNRGDALSHLGIARELQGVVGAACALPAAAPPETGTPAPDRAGVTIEDRTGCPLYLGRLIDGVTVGPAPAWLQVRLLAVGQRPVSNVVDATNCVMLESGQPLHPFDFDRLTGGRIVVRAARNGERFVTLDGRERTLDDAVTVIADAARAVAIGGVMGGLESEVTDTTRTILLESAHFDPVRVGRTARRLGIPSEASIRFTRGADPSMTKPALDRAARLIAEVSGGSVAPGVVMDGTPPPAPAPLFLRHARLAALVGRPFEAAEARAALTSIGFGAESEPDGLRVQVPAWRFDVAREVDLIEEVARVTGYDAIPVVPLATPAVAPAATLEERGRARLQAALEGAGFDEARTPSFVGDDVLRWFRGLDRLVEIRNPISKAERFLRPFVLATLAPAVARNLRRGAVRAKLYEIGHAFAAGEPVEERRSVALAAAGDRVPLDWSGEARGAYDFFDLKGDVVDALARAGAVRPQFHPGGRPYLHPGRQAEIVGADGARIGFCGEIAPGVAEAWGVEARLLVAELELAPLVAPAPSVMLVPVAREPAVERDLALVVPEETPAADVVAAIGRTGVDHLADVAVFDRYSGPQVDAGHVSLGIRLTFQADRTLTDADVEENVKRLTAGLAADLGWRLR